MGFCHQLHWTASALCRRSHTAARTPQWVLRGSLREVLSCRPLERLPAITLRPTGHLRRADAQPRWQAAPAVHEARAMQRVGRSHHLGFALLARGRTHPGASRPRVPVRRPCRSSFSRLPSTRDVESSFVQREKLTYVRSRV